MVHAKTHLIDLLHHYRHPNPPPSFSYNLRTRNPTISPHMLPFPSPQYFFDSSLSGQFEASPTPQKPNPSSPFFPFSPPTFDSFHELLFATQLQPMSDINDKVAPPSMDPPSNKEGAAEPTPPANCSRGKATPGRKRVMRKDRHSKIFTAQGPRDRRMRLSLEVARKFFDLQDLLGFDKPSKTLQWLLTKSKSAIKDISGASRPKAQAPCSSINSLKSESSTSDCEDASTVSNYKGKSLETIIPNEANISKAKSVSGHPPRKAATHPALSRESRAKARARARERTREKKKLQSGLLDSDERPNRLISSSIPYDSNGEVSISQDPKSTLELAAEVVLCSSLPNQFKGSLMDRVLEGIPGPAGPIPMFDYNICDNSTVNIIQEQWDMHFPGSIEERVSLADVQLPTKPWEAFNYSIL